MANRSDVRVRVDFSHYPRVARHLQDRADAIVRATALDLEAQMKVRAPVDTGFLRGSIQTSRVKAGHWRVVVGADYGIYLEYGTVHNRPQPFRDPAIRVVRPKFIRAMKAIMEGAP